MSMPRHHPVIRRALITPPKFSSTRSTGSSKERPKTITMRVARSRKSSTGRMLVALSGVKEISTRAVVGSVRYATAAPVRNRGMPAPRKARVYFRSRRCSPGATKAHSW